MTDLAALTLSLLPQWPALPRAHRSTAEADVVAYVERQIRRMPTFLRVPFLCVLAVFSIGALLRHGGRFKHLPATKRRAWINVWALSRVIPMRDFIKMIRSCALLAWFDHPIVAAALSEQEKSSVP